MGKVWKEIVGSNRSKHLLLMVGVLFVLLLNVICIDYLLRDDAVVPDESKAETKTEFETPEQSSEAETEMDINQVIRDERKLSEQTLQLATAKLDEYYTNLRGFYYVKETRTFQIYWDIDWKKYVVIVEKRGDDVNVILNVNSESSVSIYDAKKQIESGNYETGGELVLLHEGEFTMEPTTVAQGEQFRYIGGYLLRMISGVGVQRSAGKPYRVKAFLEDFTYSRKQTHVDVYYDLGYQNIGYSGPSNQISWDYRIDSQSRINLASTRITWTGQQIRAWQGSFDQLNTDNCDLFLEGDLEEAVGAVDGYEFINWGPLLHAAWMLYLDGRETTEGVMKGDIYLSEINGTFYRGWICFDGDEPIKVSAKEDNVLAKTIYIFEDAVFSKAEVESALGKLKFELTIGGNWTAES